MIINIKHFILIIISIFVTSAHAFDTGIKPYVEGSVGYFHSNPTMIGNFTYFNGDPVTSSNIKTSFSNQSSYGFEIGLANILPNVRIAASANTAKLKGRTTGTITTNIKNYEDIDKGYSKTIIYMLNIYYDFEKILSQARPYIGVGAGQYHNREITKNEPISGLIAGIHYDVDKNIYLGIKANYYLVSSATTSDTDRNSLSSHKAYSINALVGYKF